MWKDWLKLSGSFELPGNQEPRCLASRRHWKYKKRWLSCTFLSFQPLLRPFARRFAPRGAQPQQRVSGDNYTLTQGRMTLKQQQIGGFYWWNGKGFEASTINQTAPVNLAVLMKITRLGDTSGDNELLCNALRLVWSHAGWNHITYL